MTLREWLEQRTGLPDYLRELEEPTVPYQVWPKGRLPDFDRWEIINALTNQFNEGAVKYTTDPRTGKVIATKSVDPNVPDEVKRQPWYRQMFGEGPMTGTWVLPKEAMSGPKFTQRDTPLSDEQRQTGFEMGAALGNTTRASVNPTTFWPSSAFKVPMRNPGSRPEGRAAPEFGSIVDYTTGQWRTPKNRFGDTSRWGTFDAEYKTPPELPWRPWYIW